MRLDPITLLSSCLNQYILLQQKKQLKTPFPISLPNGYPVFSDCFIIKLPQENIFRLQLFIILDFALT